MSKGDAYKDFISTCIILRMIFIQIRYIDSSTHTHTHTHTQIDAMVCELPSILVLMNFSIRFRVSQDLHWFADYLVHVITN